MLYHFLEERLREAAAQFLPPPALTSISVRPCPEPRFGDYQSNSLIAPARESGLNPRQLAEKVARNIRAEPWADPPEIAGPGFINFRLKTGALEEHLAEASRGAHLFFRKAAVPQKVVVDFSSPNVAKPMHVGHIRSTILGDTLARTYRKLGHQVITDNHIGDWGTQFGLLLEHVSQTLPEVRTKPDSFRITDLEQFYKEAKKRFDEDPRFADAARQAVVQLQSGDPLMRKLWESFCRESLRHCQEIYDRLGVKFDVVLGESFYNDRLKEVVRSLREKGICRESEGALAVFFEDSPELRPFPAIVQKSDGGYNYLTTDLATLQYREERWAPDLVVYVTDARQQLHFKQLFATYRRWHLQSNVRLEHVWFGTILGADGKPFRTRSGENIKLTELLDEAEQRAFEVVTAKNPELPEADRREISRKVGLGAIKYADLLPNRQSDYLFSWEKMLALNGNTAPYLLYAFTRVRSIFRKSGASASGPALDRLILGQPAELSLAKHLVNFGFILNAVATESRPNFLCNYLFELAGFFAAFYESCPVLKAEEPVRQSRLALSALTAEVLQQGLEVLGIETSEQM